MDVVEVIRVGFSCFIWCGRGGELRVGVFRFWVLVVGDGGFFYWGSEGGGWEFVIELRWL